MQQLLVKKYIRLLLYSLVLIYISSGKIIIQAQKTKDASSWKLNLLHHSFIWDLLNHTGRLWRWRFGSRKQLISCFKNQEIMSCHFSLSVAPENSYFLSPRSDRFPWAHSSASPKNSSAYIDINSVFGNKHLIRGKKTHKRFQGSNFWQDFKMNREQICWTIGYVKSFAPWCRAIVL